MWILMHGNDILAEGTRDEMEKELDDLIGVCLAEEARSRFTICEDKDRNG